MPSPLTLAAAVAAKTETMPINIAAIVLPLHDPIRLAEQLATVDLIARGRVSSVVGIGYAEHEFAMAGVERKQRAKLLEEYVDVMRKAWTGEEFEWRGRTIRVRPKPFSRPHPPLFMGGGAEASARRAARMGMWFLPTIGDPELKRIYDEECEKVGYQGMCVLPFGPAMVHVAEDPEKAWDQIKDYAMYDAHSYARVQTAGNRSLNASSATNIDELRAEGLYRVVSPDECVALAEELGPGGTIIMRPLMSGMPAELGWESLELFRTKVLPRIRP